MHLDIVCSQDWLLTPASEWALHLNFQAFEAFIKEIPTTNEIAERGINVSECCPESPFHEHLSVSVSICQCMSVYVSACQYMSVYVSVPIHFF